MAHFAELDDSNIVLRVIVVRNEDCAGGDFPSSEVIGVEYCHRLYGGRWVQTSYNANFRGQYASIGCLYDVESDRFVNNDSF